MSSGSPDLILASDRPPVALAGGPAGVIATTPPGSVTQILDAAIRACGRRVAWLAASSRAVDAPSASAALQSFTARAGYDVELLRFDEQTYRSYYDQVGVRMLWFANQSLWEELPAVDFSPADVAAFDGGYQVVNERFAARISELSGSSTSVILHDYQLATATAFLRARRPRQLIAHFTHTPFATPDSLARLPRRVARSFLHGMLAADVLCFQRRLWAERFLACCQALGRDVAVDAGAADHGPAVVGPGGRVVPLRWLPIAIDAPAVRARAFGPLAEGWWARLARRPDELRVVRVDRLDPVKNAERGFEAFGLLLDRRPDLRRRLHFVACFIPSRPGVPEYRWYAARVEAAIDRVNARFPGAITVLHGHDLDRALAVLRTYDVLVVNSLADGMNLVAQEGPTVNERDGVVVLPSAAGAADLLRDVVALEEPRDTAATAGAIEIALGLLAAERRRRAGALKAAIAARSPALWLSEQLAALQEEGDRPAGQAGGVASGV